MQSLAEAHETPISWLWIPSSGLGTIFQVLPFQVSASVSDSTAALAQFPTATQELAETQETPERSP
jgi:hypothetical protein